MCFPFPSVYSSAKLNTSSTLVLGFQPSSALPAFNSYACSETKIHLWRPIHQLQTSRRRSSLMTGLWFSPPGTDTDKYEVLCVQTETVCLNCVCAIDLKKSLMDVVNRVTMSLNLKVIIWPLRSKHKIFRFQFMIILGLPDSSHRVHCPPACFQASETSYGFM